MLKAVKRNFKYISLVVLAGTAVWVAVAPLLADALVADRPIGHADAIVILSGAADYLQRAQGGADAFHEGVAPRIFVTDDNQRGGWDNTEKGNPYFIDRTIRYLIRQGVPAEAIERLPGQVHGTDEEADLAMRTAVERGYKGILLITSDYHSKRALWVFDRAALKLEGSPAIGLRRSPRGAAYPDRFTWWLSCRGWSSIAAEYLKFGYYWLYY